ncbi:tetratricopeptide repeat protein [Streptomyces sp. HGB0020]|uniref:tetratricopeptide repeat protein n=1 Tax=Streptomyces sp. HGB0020 TaxID=1078086 RepID=UPI00131A44C0|nr:hypothetical protein [Streptomyces sp. HGB0020]
MAEAEGGAPSRLASRAHIGLGRVALWMEDADRAEREFRRAVRLRPADRGPLYWLGCAAAHRGAQDRGAYELAELRFTEVVERWPGDGPSLVQRAHVRVRLGRPADALADLRSAERIGPLDAEARWVLAALSGATAPDVARRLGTAARSAMERAGATGPKGRRRAADDWNRAAALLDRARQLDPGNREFTLPHAVALCLSGRREDGIAVITDATRSAPTDRHLAHTLAVMTWHALTPTEGTDTAADGTKPPRTADTATGPTRTSGAATESPRAADHPTGRTGTSGGASHPPHTSDHAEESPRTADTATNQPRTADDTTRPTRATDTPTGPAHTAGGTTPSPHAAGHTAGPTDASGGATESPHTSADATNPSRTSHRTVQSPRTADETTRPTRAYDTATYPPHTVHRAAQSPRTADDATPPRSSDNATESPHTADRAAESPHTDNAATGPTHTSADATTPPHTPHPNPKTPAATPNDDPLGAWSRAVASWAGLLHDGVFWEGWRVGVGGRYGVVVGDKELGALRADLQGALEALMPEGDAGGRVSPEVLLGRETEAARLLAEAGGLPLATGSAPLVCGPLRIVELGREAELGAFVSAAGDAAPALRQAFSHLGFAQALLRLDRPAEALAALSGLRCPSCRARGGSGDEGRRTGAATSSGRGGGERAGGAAANNGQAAAPRAERGAVCDPDCTRFDTRNPAYAGQAAKHILLMRDGRSLALAARLAQGRAALSPAGPDARRAATSWQRALTHARAIGQGPEVEAIVADTALAAAKALHRAGDIDAAGSTLEAAYALLGEGQHERLKGQLARVLTDRGIAQANRDMDRLEGPAADLRRAVEINPHLHRAQTNLGVVLRILGARMRWSGSLVGCRSRLQEALDRVTAALQHFPGDPELSQLRDLVEADLALVHSELEQGRIGGLP